MKTQRLQSTVELKSQDAEMYQALRDHRKTCAERMLAMYYSAKAGHIGPSLSCLEILVFLTHKQMARDDRLILSKGHAAGALYTTLSLSGRLPEAQLDEFYKNGTLLAAHPPCSGKVEAIPFGTGSLGHGLGLACGLAYSQRFTKKAYHVFVVLSDGDCNEGSTWEAVLFAAHHHLCNLTIIVDANGLQGIDTSKNVLNMDSLEGKFRAFGFDVAIAEDGNDFQELDGAHRRLENSINARCIIANTVKGHGISFMENRVEWHYLPMTETQYLQALHETRTAVPHEK